MATDSETVDGVLMDDDNASYDKAAIDHQNASAEGDK